MPLPRRGRALECDGAYLFLASPAAIGVFFSTIQLKALTARSHHGCGTSSLRGFCQYERPASDSRQGQRLREFAVAVFALTICVPTSHIAALDCVGVSQRVWPPLIANPAIPKRSWQRRGCPGRRDSALTRCRAIDAGRPGRSPSEHAADVSGRRVVPPAAGPDEALHVYVVGLQCPHAQVSSDTLSLAASPQDAIVGNRVAVLGESRHRLRFRIIQQTVVGKPFIHRLPFTVIGVPRRARSPK